MPASRRTPAGASRRVGQGGYGLLNRNLKNSISPGNALAFIEHDTFAALDF